MAPITCLLIACNLLVVCHSQFIVPEFPKWSTPNSTRRLAEWAETLSFQSLDCDAQLPTQLHKYPIGCGLTYTKKMAVKMGLPDEWDGFSIKWSCDGDSVSVAQFPNANCAGLPFSEMERKIGECDQTQSFVGGVSEKTISCSTEHDTAVMKFYQDASCSESQLLGSGKTWRGDIGQCVLGPDMTYGKSGCNEDNTYSFKRYSDSNCTSFIQEDFAALAPGDCVPSPYKDDEIMASMFVKIEGDLGCGLEWDDATSGTVHMAAFGSVLWLVVQSIMLFQ